MPVAWARAIEWMVLAWVGCGVAFAAVFLARGVQAIDPLAKGASWGFRLIVFPGTVLFWPLLAARWARAIAEPPVESNAHRRLARRAAADRPEAPR